MSHWVLGLLAVVVIVVVSNLRHILPKTKGFPHLHLFLVVKLHTKLGFVILGILSAAAAAAAPGDVGAPVSNERQRPFFRTVIIVFLLIGGLIADNGYCVCSRRCHCCKGSC